MPSWSPYSYTFDNPVRYVDPTGMIAEDCPKCPNPQKADESRYGSDGKYYTATEKSEGSSELEWLRTESIQEVKIAPSEKAQANYNLRQARSRLYTAEYEFWKSQALSLTVGGEIHGVLFNAHLSVTLAFNMGDGTPQLFGSAGGKLGFDYAMPGASGGAQLGVHQTYGSFEGEKYTDVFGGMEGESTGWAGSAFLGGEQNKSSKNGIIIDSYGVKNTYLNLGLGYGLGKTTSTTVNINKWLKKNVRRTHQFN